MVKQVTCNKSQMLEMLIYVPVFFLRDISCVPQQKTYFFLRLLQGFLKNVQIY